MIVTREATALIAINTETITGGTGADTITLGAAITAGTIDLAAGTDTLILANGINSDSGSQYQTRYTNYLVQASGSAGYVPANLATSYVFTFVNDLGQESAPSLPSATVFR